MRQKRRNARIRRALLTLLMILILLAAIAAILVWKVFVVKEVEVVGNEIYTDKQIESWVLDGEKSWNSLYVILDDKFRKQEAIPFVASMEISLKSPSKVQIEVVEKGVLGYLYIPTLGKNAYFDKDGFVVEISPDIIEGVTKISGLSVETAELYQKLELEDQSILRTLLSLTQLLKKYETIPERIYVHENGIVLVYGKIQVEVGNGASLNEKILRMKEILPQIEGKKGTLHLETWSEDNTDIYFKKKELLKIPEDVQSVPKKTEENNSEKNQEKHQEKH